MHGSILGLGHCVVCVVAIQGIKVKRPVSGFKVQNAPW